MIKQFISVILFLVLGCLYAFSQGEISTEPTLLFRNEQSFGLELTSNGWGANFKYGKHLSNTYKKLFEIQFVEIKHPKEVKTTNPYYPNQKRFVFGKQNSFYNLRFGYGKQKKLYGKMDKGGLEIRFSYTAGLNIGLVKPIYYEVIDSIVLYQNIPYTYTGTTTFDQNIHSPYDIISRASFFKGSNETKIIPGIYGSASFGFEFSKEDRIINSLEAGATIDIFSSNIEIISNKYSFLFVSLFVCYRFGKVTNARIKEKKEKPIDEIE